MPSIVVADTATIGLETGDTPHLAARDEARTVTGQHDLGIGVLHLGLHATAAIGGVILEDTVLIRNMPHLHGVVAARFIVRHGGSVFEYRIETSEAGLRSRDFEWGYEESGLAVDTVAASGPWAHVLYAVDTGGEPRFGWARITAGTRMESWTDVLLEQNVFFRHPDSLAFYASPYGDTVPVKIGRGVYGLDYTMHPLRAWGDWMKVVVTAPGNCTATRAARSDTVWIRYLDKRGRPRVWYPTRGC